MKIRKRCERIIEIDAEDFLKKKKIKKYGRIKRIWKTIQKNYAWRGQTTKERIHERILERLKKSSIQPCDEENKRKWKIMK